MSATALLMILAIALLLLSAAAIWAACLLAGAARPMRRGSRSSTGSDVIVPTSAPVWRTRSQSASRGSPLPRRAGILRRSIHSPWRE